MIILFKHRLPNHVSLDEGALIEPLSVNVHAARRVGVTLGSRVLVCGAGTIGLAAMMTARSMGAAKICLTGELWFLYMSHKCYSIEGKLLYSMSIDI